MVLVGGAIAVFESYQGVPYGAAILFALRALFWLITTKTPFGRHVYAVGGSAEAARRAGINVVGIRIACFTLCSTLAAVGGILWLHVLLRQRARSTRCCYSMRSQRP